MKAVLACLAATLVLAATPTRAADTAFAAIAEKIRQAEESAPGVPMDVALYADQVTYGHNIGPTHTEPAAKLLAGIGPEQDAFKRFVADRQARLVRFVASGDSVVTVTEMKGRLDDQTSFETKTAFFFTIENGRIAKLEVWVDPILGRKFGEYMAKDPAVIAARQQK